MGMSQSVSYSLACVVIQVEAALENDSDNEELLKLQKDLQV
jgi:hypothetical protein